MRPAPAAPPASSPSELRPASPAASEAPAPLLVLGALFALYVIWGSTYFGIRVALTGFPPLLLAGVRFLCAGGLLFLVLRLRGQARPTLKQWLSAGAVGVLLVTLGNGCVVFAQQSVASSVAAVMVASMPLFAAVFSGLWGQWPGTREWAGLVLGLCGVVLLNLDGELRASPAGAALLLLAPAAWAFGSVWSRRLDMPKGLMASAVQMLAGGAVLFVGGLVRGESLPASPAPAAVGALLYLITFGSLVGYSAYGFLLRTVRPTLATSYAYVNPVVALGLGMGLGGETVGPRGLLGAGVILAGVALVALARARR